MWGGYGLDPNLDCVARTVRDEFNSHALNSTECSCIQHHYGKKETESGLTEPYEIVEFIEFLYAREN